MIGFLKILAKSGLLTWRDTVRCRVGCFFVRKKGGKSLRLVLDARVANAMHKTAPKSSLAIPAALAALDFSEEALNLADLADMSFSDPDVPPSLVTGAWSATSDPDACDEELPGLEADSDVPELLAVSAEEARKTWTFVEAIVDSGSAVMGFQHLAFWISHRDIYRDMRGERT